MAGTAGGQGERMALLFRLPLLLLELLLRRLIGWRDDDRVGPVVTDEAARPMPPRPGTPGAGPAFTGAAANGAPPPTADEALRRTAEREAEEIADPPPPPTPLRPIGDAGHIETESTVVESFGDPDEVGGTITVDEPWPGYDRDPASAIVTRLGGADPATKGVVALYERSHKNRKTVIQAAG